MEAFRVLDIIITLTGGSGFGTSTLTFHIYRTAFTELDLGIGNAYSYVLLGIVMVVATLYFVLLSRRR
jgi:multiple sugar transport system permease protein